MKIFDKVIETIKTTDTFRYTGRVTRIAGLAVESEGPISQIGDICNIYPNGDKKPIMAEVVGFKGESVLLMPFGDLGGVGPGSRVVSTNRRLMVGVGDIY
ncbi:MAG TPA: EscN/YscN/HrcN family type III secretion system ATPase, partial [Clostridia bacterium]|nr:EscN/YscN/HrcN family type III secretion system ATPase [Clostridia bacterium]